MDSTIKDNLLYGIKEPISVDAIIYYSELTGADRFIFKLNITKAFIHNPNVLLLDEATSNLDIEQVIQKSLKYLMKDRTTVIIAHRLSTIKKADQIIFIDNGIITGRGNHEELLKEHRKYQNFVKTQAISNELGAKTYVPAPFIISAGDKPICQ